MSIRSSFLILTLLFLPGSLPVTTVAAIPATTADEHPASGFRSRNLRELHANFLKSGDEKGFWEAVSKISDAGGYPFIEEKEVQSAAPPNYVSVTFLHRQGTDSPDNVLLFANINHVLPSELLFERIGVSGVYFKTVELPQGVRFQYRIIENDPLTPLFGGAKYGTRLNVLEGDPDPLNPNKRIYPEGLGEGKEYIETWLELPGASPQPYIRDRGNPRGDFVTEERESEILGYSRRTITYLPPGYDPGTLYPLMILFDGGSYFEEGFLQLTLDNLIAEGSIPPLVVLGIEAGAKDGQTQRNDEFTCNPKFMRVVKEELLPWFTSKYSVSRDPARRIIAGSSFGGLFAAYFAFNHPETVSHVLSQSGSYHWGIREDTYPYEWLVRQFAFADRKPITIYMEVGVLEGEYSWTYPGFPHQIVSHRHFKTVLDMKGYDVTYREYGGGHEMLSWRGGIAEGLKHIFVSLDEAVMNQ